MIGSTNPTGDGWRVVLGVISMPSASHPLESEPESGLGVWKYFAKAGVGIRRGRATVTVTVPKPWRSRVGIGWGNRTVILSSIRFSGCPGSTSPSWSAYAGGFYLRRHTACVPLVVGDGHRTTTVRIAIDWTCR
jgi:hypothetical protein